MKNGTFRLQPPFWVRCIIESLNSRFYCEIQIVRVKCSNTRFGIGVTQQSKPCGSTTLYVLRTLVQHNASGGKGSAIPMPQREVLLGTIWWSTTEESSPRTQNTSPTSFRSQNQKKVCLFKEGTSRLMNDRRRSCHKNSYVSLHSCFQRWKELSGKWPFLSSGISLH